MAGPPLTTSRAFPGIASIDAIGSFLPIAPIPNIGALPASSASNEFRPDALPARVKEQFQKGPDFWREALAEAIRAGLNNPDALADLIFFMQYRKRIVAGVGKLIDKNEQDFIKLRPEWNLYRTIVLRRLDPSLIPSVFLPDNPASNYEDYVGKPRTGRITLMVNGRNSGGSGSVDNQVEPFDSMQETVESLGANDSVYLATWQFRVTSVPLTLTDGRPAGMNWGDLFQKKARDGVKIRVIISNHPPVVADFQTNLAPINKLIEDLPFGLRDNWKYIHSSHTADLAGDHHQKFMVVKKGKTAVAFCGGLDISSGRTAAGWGDEFVWHDVHAKLQGLIVRDLDREFVFRWNREKDKSSAARLAGWKDFETLAQVVDSSDGESASNTHELQVLRTVSRGINQGDLKRDDIWQGYFRLIGRATSFLYLENQYFHEPKLADAIVKQAQAQPGLIVIVVVASGTDDTPSFYTRHANALRHEFFGQLSKGIPANQLGVYTVSYKGGLLHSKLILVDDEVLSMGSANANPRGFFLDSELNVMLDDADAVTAFRRRLWSHNLGVLPARVATWKVGDFLREWELVAKFNAGKSIDKAVGERIVRFDKIPPGAISPLPAILF